MEDTHISQIQLVPYHVGSAADNMATDAFLLSKPGTFLRFYGWQKPALSFGRLKQGIDQVDLSICHEHNIEFIKRLSGGRAILHQYELTYAFISDIKLFDASIMNTYRQISNALSTGLGRLGLKTDMRADVADSGNSPICFEHASAYELTVNGKKLVGSAQYRKGDRFFQHGSILLDIDWELWNRIWKLNSSDTRLKRRVTTLLQELKTIPDTEKIIQTLSTAFVESFQATQKAVRLKHEDLALISNLARDKQWRLR